MTRSILPHLENSLPKDIKNHFVSSYTVALEAWRRGLDVKFHNAKRGASSVSDAYHYSISDNQNEYRFICARGPHTDEEAIRITQNKPEAKIYFEKAGVPVPKGAVFEFKTTPIDKIVDYGQSLGFPLVVKPTNLGGGKGVFTQIKNVNDLKESLLEIKDKIKVNEVMIEKYFSGIDYRFFVMKNKVLAVTKSYSSYIVGDGKHTIEHLIEVMNEKIKKNIVHNTRKINIDNDLLSYLDEQGLSLAYIPPENQRVFVRRHGTYLKDRLNVDCTDEVDDKFNKYAVKAINSVEGIPYGSVDMIINEEQNEGVVNEINTKGVIAMHYYPIEGIARDIPKAIIDYYFPNTETLNNTLYFDFKPIKGIFLDGLAKEITIPNIINRTLYRQSGLITGRNLKAIYLRRIHRKAAANNLSGTIIRVSEDKIKLELFGTKKQLTNFTNYLRKSGTKKSVIENLELSDVELDKGYHSISLAVRDYYNKKSPVNVK